MVSFSSANSLGRRKTSLLARHPTVVVVALLSATLLGLGARDAEAQVYATDDCVLPANSVFADDEYVGFGACFSLQPPGHCDYIRTALELSGFGICDLPPDSGSAVTISFGAFILSDVLDRCYGGGDGPTHAIYSRGKPNSRGIVVSFNHQEGATRYFDLQMAGFDDFASNGPVVVGDGVGQLTIEDVGDGWFQFDGFLDVAEVDLAPDGCDYTGTGGAHLALSMLTSTDVPRAHGVRSLALAGAVPNPVRSRARVRLTLPSDGPATLKVYDVAGRQVASLLDGKQLSAGPHDVNLDTHDWRPGCYFLRLSAHGERRTQVVVVAR